jgi:hypothetical protein
MGTRIKKISKYRPSLFQGRLDFAAVGGVSFSVEHPFERVAFRTLCVVLVALMCGYLYFVSASVLNIIARREADAKTAQLQGSIAQMEQQYFALSQTVDPQEASALGLAPLSNTQYVYVPGNAASAGSLASNAI